MLYLLKQSSKKINKREKRKVVPILGTIKDYHAQCNREIAEFQRSQAENNAQRSSLDDGQNESESQNME